MSASVYSRAVRKAADVLGGRERLARVLLVPVAEIDRWIAGRARPPRELFLRIVDIVLEESGPGGESEARDAPPGRDCAGAASPSFE